MTVRSNELIDGLFANVSEVGLPGEYIAQLVTEASTLVVGAGLVAVHAGVSLPIRLANPRYTKAVVEHYAQGMLPERRAKLVDLRILERELFGDLPGKYVISEELLGRSFGSPAGLQSTLKNLRDAPQEVNILPAGAAAELGLDDRILTRYNGRPGILFMEGDGDYGSAWPSVPYEANEVIARAEALAFSPTEEYWAGKIATAAAR